RGVTVLQSLHHSGGRKNCNVLTFVFGFGACGLLISFAGALVSQERPRVTLSAALFPWKWRKKNCECWMVAGNKRCEGARGLNDRASAFAGFRAGEVSMTDGRAASVQRR
ncbi:MAG: hypothetical protein WBL50_00195, partial [Candidatus Acidiferrum sp.]